MSDNAYYNIELKQTFSLISAKALISNKQVFLDLFSHQPLWVLCVNKSSLAPIKKFSLLNKNYHYLCQVLIFTKPDNIRKNLEPNLEKTEMFWIEKQYREDIFRALKLTQLPWVIAFEQGKIIFSAHDFPIDFSELVGFKEAENSPKSVIEDNTKKLFSFKEQIHTLNKKLKKKESKEIEYKSEIAELKASAKDYQMEITDLKRKIKDFEYKISMTPEPDMKKLYLNTLKEPKQPPLRYPKSIEHDDIWSAADDSNLEIKELSEITGSRELWINHAETKMIKIPNLKQPLKLFPIKTVKKNTKSHSMSRDMPTIKVIPEILKNLNKRHT